MTLPMPQSMTERCSHCMGSGTDRTSFRHDECEMCGGEGILDEVECDLCNGEGCENCRSTGRLENVRCPSCDGRGEVQYHPYCDHCSGSGEVPASEYELV